MVFKQNNSEFQALQNATLKKNSGFLKINKVNEIIVLSSDSDNDIAKTKISEDL